MLHSATAHLKLGGHKEQFNCAFCPMCFDNRQELMEHSAATHLKKVIASSSTNVKPTEDQSNTSEPLIATPFKCVMCVKSFAKNDNFDL